MVIEKREAEIVRHERIKERIIIIKCQVKDLDPDYVVK